jgi:hypothetical protein
MAPDESQEVSALSDTQLLDCIEQLLCTPGFIDLALGYDHESREFYAGCEAGKSLRDLLRTVLVHNRPSGVALQDLLPPRRTNRVA